MTKIETIRLHLVYSKYGRQVYDGNNRPIFIPVGIEGEENIIDYIYQQIINTKEN
jgi:hypothetical protein